MRTVSALAAILVTISCHTQGSPLDGPPYQYAPIVESSVDGSLQSPSSREAKQFFFSRTTTITVTAGTVTSTLTTFRTCYTSAPVAIPTCVSTILVGRRKRDAASHLLEESANAFDQEGQPIDFKNLISATKASARSEEPAMADPDPVPAADSAEMYRVDNSELEAKFGDGSGSRREGRFVTYVTTSTASVTATVTLTTTPLPVSTIFFSSIAAGQCFPAGLMAAAGIQACP